MHYGAYKRHALPTIQPRNINVSILHGLSYVKTLQFTKKVKNANLHISFANSGDIHLVSSVTFFLASVLSTQ